LSDTLFDQDITQAFHSRHDHTAPMRSPRGLAHAASEPSTPGSPGTSATEPAVRTRRPCIPGAASANVHGTKTFSMLIMRRCTAAGHAPQLDRGGGESEGMQHTAVKGTDAAYSKHTRRAGALPKTRAAPAREAAPASPSPLGVVGSARTHVGGPGWRGGCWC